MNNLKPMYRGIPYSPPTHLVSPVSAAATEIHVENGAVFPDPPSLAVLGIDENAETILYTVRDGNILRGITRGVQGSARAWLIGTPIARNFTESDHGALIDNILTLEEHVNTTTTELQDDVDETVTELKANVAQAITSVEQATQLAIQTLEEETEKVLDTLRVPLAGAGMFLDGAFDDIAPVPTGPLPRAVAVAELGNPTYIGCAACAAGGSLYVIGPAQLNTFRRINVAARTQEVLPPGPAANVYRSPMSYHNGFIYMLGFTGLLNQLWRYNIKARVWERMADYPLANPIGALGGWINGRWYLTVSTTSPVALHSYNPETNSWTGHAPKQSGLATENGPTWVMDNRLWTTWSTAAGHSQVYDPASDSWENFALPPVNLRPHAHGTTTAIHPTGEYVFVLGRGATTNAASCRYFPATNTWQNHGTINVVSNIHWHMFTMGTDFVALGNDAAIIRALDTTEQMAAFTQNAWQVIINAHPTAETMTLHGINRSRDTRNLQNMVGERRLIFHNMNIKPFNSLVK